jgi:hypothetical protein
MEEHDERSELTTDELESESAEALPDREAMSILPVAGDPIGAHPPVEEWGADPIRGDEGT